MKLKTKIQLFSSVFMLLLLLIINTAIYFMFYKVQADSELEELHAHTESVMSALNENPDVVEKELLRAFLPNDGMIRIVSEDGSFLHQLTKRKAYLEQDSISTPSEIKKIYTTKKLGKMAVVAKPMIWHDGEVVILEVTKELVALQENMQTLLYVLVIAAILMLIPTLLASKMLSQFLLKPIHALIQAMKENTTAKHWQKIDMDHRSKDEIYEMEQTFNQMITALEENFQKQETFISDASHELKTPIAIIKSYAQLLKRRGLENPEVFSESVDAIHSESERMQHLVEQLLLLAKNEVDTTREVMDFSAVCQETIQTIKGAYHRDIHYQVSGTNNVYGNKNQLQQIVYVLVMNAIKYSETPIDIRLFSEKNQVVLQVKDYGEGIDKEDQKRIFDRFYRVDRARSRETGGTGLGLPIATSIAHAHGGQITVESNLGEGSTFTVYLPKK